jgi:BirA family biotin operon repressor/biotin-[acetyl-CoA-carboxylase] ligase
MRYKIIEFDKLDSTNNHAKKNAEKLEDKTVIVAAEQTNGRGRFDRKWLSDKGGLYFTLLLKPKNCLFLHNLTQLMCVAVCKTAREYEIDAYIKWPNDVHAGGKKLCGILGEGIIKGSEFYALTLGVGINAQQENMDGINQPAASFKTLGVRVSRKTILKKVLSRFFAPYKNLLESGFSVIREDYMSMFPFIGAKITISAERELKGIISKVDDDGRLVLKDSRGKEHHISAGEIL